MKPTCFHRAILLIAFVLSVFFLGGAAVRGADTPSAWPALRINEWMAYNFNIVGDPFDNDFEDWFELYNPTTNAVDLTGWFLSDNTNQPARYVVPEGHIIPPFGFLLVWADGEPEQNSTNSPDLHVNFSLEKNGERILLTAPDGSLVDSVVFSAQSMNNSQGRFPDGGGTIGDQVRPTPYAANLGAFVRPGVGRLTLHSNYLTIEITSAIPTLYYGVEYKDGLGATNWRTLGRFFAGHSAKRLVDLPATNSQRFYRVQWLEDVDD